MLSMFIVDPVKSVTNAGNLFSLLERLYVFISGSYAHNKWLEVQREMFDGPPRELQRYTLGLQTHSMLQCYGQVACNCPGA